MTWRFSPDVGIVLVIVKICKVYNPHRGRAKVQRFFLGLFLVLAPSFVQGANVPQPLYLDYIFDAKGVDPIWSRLARNDLYVLAWSSQGQVLTAQTDQRAQRVTFIIWDTIDDRAVLQQTVRGWAGQDESAWWVHHSGTLKEWKTQWNLHDCDYQLGNFPLIDPNDVYFQASLQLDRPASRAWGTRLRLLLHGGGLGTKIILERHGLWQRALLVGFVPSPYEDRLLVIVAVQSSGWQAAQTPIHFVLVGASLVVGFGP